MKKFFQISLLCFSITSLNGQSINFIWANTIGGSAFEYSAAIATDASGNVYTTGYFDGTVDFDPGTGTYNLTSNGSSDIFVLKINAAGNFVWARNMGGALSDNGKSVAVDASGNVYIAGGFQDIADFDPGPGTSNLTSAGNYDIFVLKMNASGNLVWAKNLGGTSSESGSSIAVDPSGNVYTTGAFDNTADFDPGPATYNLTPANVNLSDIFVSKLDASGNFGWAIRFGDIAPDAGYSITSDVSGNIYVTGYFHGTIFFGCNTLSTSLTFPDVFVIKLNAAGGCLWAIRMGGTSSDVGQSITTDASGNVYTTGYFRGTSDFDPGPGTYNLTALGFNDIFISKLNGSGNFVWAKSIGNVAGANNTIGVDVMQNVYVAGAFEGTIDFDPGAGIYNLTSAGKSDIFLCKLDPSGNFAAAQRMGGDSTDIVSAIAVDASGTANTTGEFYGTADLDPGGGVHQFTSAGGTDIFVVKSTHSGLVPVKLSTFTAVNKGNDALLNWKAENQAINSSHFEIERSLNGLDFIRVGRVDVNLNSGSAATYNFTDVNIAPLSGVAYYRIKLVDKDDKFAYSSIVAVTFNSFKNTVTVFPNPVTNTAILSIIIGAAEEIKFRLYDDKGNLVLVKQIYILPGNNSFIVDMSNLAKGIYNAIITWENRTRNVKILKQ